MAFERDRERSVFAGLKSSKQIKPIGVNTKNGHSMWPFFLCLAGVTAAREVHDAVGSVLAIALLASPSPAGTPGAG